VKELGTHILVCEVFGEKLNFRKFFKFQVMKPLDVKTKFYNAEVNKLLIYIYKRLRPIKKNPQQKKERAAKTFKMKLNTKPLKFIGGGGGGRHVQGTGTPHLVHYNHSYVVYLNSFHFKLK
jgi:hypothetical protein